MSEAVYPLDPETLYIPYNDTKQVGDRLAPQYQGKSPYDYGCFDNFLPPEIIERVREEALSMAEKSPENASANEKLKTSYKPDVMPLYTKAVFHALNSRPFIQFLERLLRLKFQVQHPAPAGHRMLRWINDTSTSTARNVA